MLKSTRAVAFFGVSALETLDDAFEGTNNTLPEVVDRAHETRRDVETQLLEYVILDYSDALAKGFSVRRCPGLLQTHSL